MNARTNEPACWSWALPTIRTRGDESMRLSEENLLLVQQKGMDHYLPDTALEMLTRSWDTYLLNSWHDERCAICGLRPGHLVVDHEHHTGLVRGRLCRGCNISEGKRRYDGGGEVYQLYRERPPAALLGVQVYYIGRGWEHGWWNDRSTAMALTGNLDWQPVEGATW